MKYRDIWLQMCQQQKNSEKVNNINDIFKEVTNSHPRDLIKHVSTWPWHVLGEGKAYCRPVSFEIKPLDNNKRDERSYLDVVKTFKQILFFQNHDSLAKPSISAVTHIFIKLLMGGFLGFMAVWLIWMF